MKLPILQELPTSREMIDVFGGYNHNLRIGEGEFYDMKNLTSSDYPVLSPRPQRGMYSAPNIDPTTEWEWVENPQGLLEKDALCYVDGTDIVINGYRIDMGLSTDEKMCPKTLVSMGAYIIIMPDKKYINTTNYGDMGNIEATFTSYWEGIAAWTHFDLCKIDGSEYQNTPALSEAPQNPVDGQMYIDTSGKTHVLRQYSETNAEWIDIATTYIRISFERDHPFNVGDGITISGIRGIHDDMYDPNLNGEEREDVLSLNGTMVIKEKGRNYIVVTGIIDKSYAQFSSNITITRLMPEMDIVIESGNRLWGCHYGFDIQGNFVNEIYASKLGDFKNWNVFDGISTDSYVATAGTDGFFTGAITHLGYPIFFKENCMHKVYGNFPANFQVQTTACRGVQQGCNKSLAIVNEVLYYKARSAVCAYDGSLPMEISSALGDVSYSDAAAGTKGNKYYISMKDTNNEYHLFVFDTKRGTWHREDNTHAIDFCTCRGELYYIDEQKSIETVKDEETGEVTEKVVIDRYIKTINIVPNASYPFEEGINWMAESGVIGVSLPDKKYISRLDVRMLLTVGTRVHFYIEYDSCGKWEHLFTMTGTKLQSFPISIRPRRCDHMRIRIEGDGEAKIFSICKTIEQGSDI